MASIFPDEYRISFMSGSEYYASRDSKAFEDLSLGKIDEQECVGLLEYHNKLSKGAITHDILIANLIWLGYFPAYKARHTVTQRDKAIESYIEEARRLALEDAILAKELAQNR